MTKVLSLINTYWANKIEMSKMSTEYLYSNYVMCLNSGLAVVQRLSRVCLKLVVSSARLEKSAVLPCKYSGGAMNN